MLLEYRSNGGEKEKERNRKYRKEQRKKREETGGSGKQIESNKKKTEAGEKCDCGLNKGRKKITRELRAMCSFPFCFRKLRTSRFIPAQSDYGVKKR